MVERLNTESPEELENSAIAKCDNLDLWAVQLDAEIASIDAHRARVAGTLRDAALEGLNLLRNAERRSKLPVGLGHLSGEPFLRVRTREPVEHAEQLARMHRVIDDVVVADQPPGVRVLRLMDQPAHARPAPDQLRDDHTRETSVRADRKDEWCCHAGKLSLPPSGDITLCVAS